MVTNGSKRDFELSDPGIIKILYGRVPFTIPIGGHAPSIGLHAVPLSPDRIHTECKSIGLVVIRIDGCKEVVILPEIPVSPVRFCGSFPGSGIITDDSHIDEVLIVGYHYLGLCFGIACINGGDAEEGTGFFGHGPDNLVEHTVDANLLIGFFCL